MGSQAVSNLELACRYQIPIPLLGILGDSDALTRCITRCLTDIVYSELECLESRPEFFRLVIRIVVSSVKYEIWRKWNAYRDSGHFTLTSSMVELVTEYFEAAQEVTRALDDWSKARMMNRRYSDKVTIHLKKS